MSSSHNIGFYQNIGLAKFKEISQLTGFYACKDMEIIFPYIENANAIAELGAGYGRCVDFLFEKNFKGEIYAIDRIPAFLDYISENHPFVHCLEQDLRDLDLPQKVDAVLWLWSGILEQNFDEQALIMHKIKASLQSGGRIFIETPRETVKHVGTQVDKHYIRVETEWGTIDGYLPYPEDIERMAKAINCIQVETVAYQTPVGINRNLYILQV